MEKIKEKDRPLMEEPAHKSINSENGRASPIEDNVPKAIKYLMEQKKKLHIEQGNAYSELESANDQLTNSQKRFENAIKGLKGIQDRLIKKNTSLEKLLSDKTSLEDKEKLAKTIITVYENDEI